MVVLQKKALKTNKVQILLPKNYSSIDLELVFDNKESLLSFNIFDLAGSIDNADSQTMLDATNDCRQVENTEWI